MIHSATNPEPVPALNTADASAGNDFGGAAVRDCWNTIGVAGDSSCPELKKHIHCRNCPVYAAAGTQLLNRALPSDYRNERTSHFAQARQNASSARASVLIFRVGPEWLALPSAAFQEVAERRPIHSLPHHRQGVVLGLVNVRGELLICVTLSRLLGLENAAPHKPQGTSNERLLVANWDAYRLVFPVDEVLGIHRFDTQELQAPPASVAKAAQTFAQGLLAWRGRTVGYLDVDSLFATLNRNLT